MLGEGLSLALAGHEDGHGYGMCHSFSADPSYCNIDWSVVGAYGDPWDIMSFAATFRSRRDTPFRIRGPGLNAYHRDRVGWIKIPDVFRFGGDGVFDRTLTLAAPLPGALGYQMIRIPFDPSDLQRYYTIEYRVRENWDDVFPTDVVLIHEVAKRDFIRCSDGTSIAGEYRSYVLNDKSTNTAFEEMNQDGIQIEVVSKNPSSCTAVVRVCSTQPARCIFGYVWREACPEDRVCVSQFRRAQVAIENVDAEENTEPGGGIFGPDTCKDGFVWQEAFPGDHVCVTPERRTLAATENSQAYWKRIGFAAYGPLTCAQGFVWREADENDYVCVVPDRRREVAAENEQADENVEPGGGDTCKQGFVWRDAFPGDRVRVVPSKRTLARNENASHAANLSNDPMNNAAASAAECVDVDCELAEEEVPEISPAALDDEASTTPGVPVVIDVSTNDSDINGNLDPNSAFLKQPGPSKGTVERLDNGQFRYTPGSTFEGGTDDFFYEICNTGGLCGQAKVTISVVVGHPADSECCDGVFFLFWPICWFFNLFGICLFG